MKAPIIRFVSILVTLACFVSVLTACDLNFGGKQETDPDGAVDSNTKLYDFTFVSNGDGTCKIVGVTFGQHNGGSFSLDFPETSPEGERVTEISYEVAFNVPMWITKSDFEEKIQPKVRALYSENEFFYRKFTSFFGRQELEDNMAESAREALLREYPILAYTPIYVFAGDASVSELLMIGEVLSDCGFTHEDKLAMEAAAGYSSAENGAVVYPNNMIGMTFPSGLREVAPMVYLGCVSLTTLTIPDCVTELKSDSLGDGRGWQIIRLPATLTKIAERGLVAMKANQILYDGTMAQWEQVEREKTSISVASDAVIICKDGRLSCN